MMDIPTGFKPKHGIEEKTQDLLEGKIRITSDEESKGLLFEQSYTHLTKEELINCAYPDNSLEWLSVHLYDPQQRPFRIIYYLYTYNRGNNTKFHFYISALEDSKNPRPTVYENLKTWHAFLKLVGKVTKHTNTKAKLWHHVIDGSTDIYITSMKPSKLSQLKNLLSHLDKKGFKIRIQEASFHNLTKDDLGHSNISKPPAVETIH